MGPARAVRRARRARTPTASSTCRSARRSTRRPPSSRRRWRRPPTPRATRRRTARRRCARPPPTGCARRLGVTGSTRTACCRRSAPRSWSPGCRPCSGSARATSSSIPALAYPTYDVGARLAGARSLVDRLDWPRVGPGAGRAGLGQLPVQPDRPGAARRAPAQGRRVGARARRAWSSATSATSSWAGTPSRSRCCTRDVCGGSHEGLLAVHSLSKRSNLAGYRAGFVAGDPALVAELLEVRKHARADRARPGAGRDGGRARRRRARRASSARATRARRDGAAGRRWRQPASGSTTREAGLYLWATRGRADCWDTVALAGRARDPGRARGLLRRRPARATCGSR